MPKLRCALCAAALLFALSGIALAAAAEGRTSIAFYPEIISDLGLAVVNTRTTAAALQEDGLAFAISPGSSLRYPGAYPNSAPFDAGSLAHAGGFSLLFEGLQLPLHGFELRASRHGFLFDLHDADGDLWFHVSHGHVLGTPRDAELILTNSDLTMSSKLAALIGRPDLAHGPVAAIEVRLPASMFGRTAAATAAGGLIESSQGTVDCRATVDFSGDRDIALTSVAGAQQRARSGGRVALAPSAVLENVGQADVEWFYSISPDEAVFANGSVGDHPYLSLYMYQLHNGRLRQLSDAGVKHAFFSTNTGCNCAGDNVIYDGCADVYMFGTNVNRMYLGPRDEIDPLTGAWQSLGSHFDSFDFVTGMIDPNLSDDVRDHQFEGEHTPFEHLVAVLESDLDEAGARFFVGAWYLIPQDVDLFNSMGYLEVDPNLPMGASVWSFSPVATFANGSILDVLVDPVSPPAGAANTLLDTGEGRLQVAASSGDAGAGMTHYEYAVMNHDFARNVDSFTVSFASGISVQNVAFASPDGDPMNDWTATVGANAVTWQAPAGADLRWGTLYNFAFDADAAAVARDVSLGALQVGSPVSYEVAAVPEPQRVATGAAALLAITVLASLQRRARSSGFQRAGVRNPVAVERNRFS